MTYAHHPYLFSHQWSQLHPDFLAKLKKYGPALALGALLAAAALFIWMIYAASDMSLMDAGAMSAAAEDIFVPTGITGYLPHQF